MPLEIYLLKLEQILKYDFNPPLITFNTFYGFQATAQMSECFEAFFNEIRGSVTKSNKIADADIYSTYL